MFFEFMMEARVKSSFPWQVSLTGFRIEVIKILVVYDHIGAYSCVHYLEKVLALRTKLSG